jgi:hypothetical protein
MPIQCALCGTARVVQRIDVVDYILLLLRGSLLFCFYRLLYYFNFYFLSIFIRLERIGICTWT